MDNRKKLVVCDENVLGYINLRDESTVWIFRALFTKGALWSMSDEAPVSRYKSIRLATEADFDYFRVSSVGFFNTPEFIHA